MTQTAGIWRSLLSSSIILSGLNGCVDCPQDLDSDGACGPVDCNDKDPYTFPGAPETCDGQDNDCDGTMDEPVAEVDQDQDGTADCHDDDCDGTTEHEGDCDDRDPHESSIATDYVRPLRLDLRSSATRANRAALVHESWYALSERQDGSSSTSCNTWTAGDWNYVIDDTRSFGPASLECMLDIYGEDQLGRCAMSAAAQCGNDTEVAHGGDSAFLVDLILLRAGGADVTGVAHYSLPSTAAFEGKPLDRTVRPGDVIFTTENTGHPVHVAIVVDILAYNYDCSPSQIDVVDSNYSLSLNTDQEQPASSGTYIIAKHKLTGGVLQDYRVWTNNAPRSCATLAGIQWPTIQSDSESQDESCRN